jgi:aminoglycoside phosphotransferase (APT) family kinase protein
MSAAVAEPVAAWLAPRLGVERVELRDLRRHTEGWSWHTYTFTAAWRDDGAERTRGFALRREPEDGLLAPYDIRGQYELHRLLAERSDVPVPALHWLELDPSVLGMPFYVMERVEGIVPVQWRPDDPRAFPDGATRRAVGQEFVDVLAGVHSVDWRDSGVAPGPDDPRSAPLAEIDRWRRFYEDAVLVEVPLLREALTWLGANPACSGRLALCHGDYRIGNFMLGAGHRIVAVFDWELAHVSDPVEDIAWAGLGLFRGRSPLYSHLLPEREFLDRYESRTGLAVEPDVLRFWTVLGYVKSIAPHIRACRAFEERRAGDLRLAAMGHQALYPLGKLAAELELSLEAVG